MSLDLAKWIRGWRLDLAWQKLFHSPDAPLPPINIQEISGKSAAILTQVNDILLSPLVVRIEALVPDIVKTIEFAKAQLPTMIAVLSGVSQMTDISTGLQDFRFSKDDKENELYHKIIKSAALIFNDGSVSINDAITVLGIFKSH